MLRALRASPGVIETSRMRGNSTYYNSADTVIKIAAIGAAANKAKLDPGDVISVTCDKSKDSDGFAPLSLTAERETWATREGQMLNALVIVQANKTAVAQAQAVKPSDLKGNPKTAYDALAQLCAGLADGATFTEWETASKLAESSFKSAREKLIELGLVKQNEHDRYYVAVQPDTQPGPRGQDGANEGQISPDEADVQAGPQGQPSYRENWPISPHSTIQPGEVDVEDGNQSTEQGHRDSVTIVTIESLVPLALSSNDYSPNGREEPRCVECGSTDVDRFDQYGHAYCTEHGWTMPEAAEATADEEVH